jgi:hypothetical protein
LRSRIASGFIRLSFDTVKHTVRVAGVYVIQQPYNGNQKRHVQKTGTKSVPSTPRRRAAATAVPPAKITSIFIADNLHPQDSYTALFEQGNTL